MIDRALRIARRLRTRRIHVSGSPVKVNLGAGIEVADGWIHVDGSIHALAAGLPEAVLKRMYRRTGSVQRAMSEGEYVDRLTRHRFVFYDLADPLPFESNTVDYIFCSHVLEHFSRDSGVAFMQEVFRVLKPRGRVRMVVPDLERAVGLYNAGAREEALSFFFTDGEPGSYNQHRYMYDFDLMKSLLLSVGFIDVMRLRYREGSLPDLEKLDNRPDESLYVEAVKP